MAVRTGQPFVVGNLDNAAHNAMVSFLRNQPVNPLIPALKEIELRMDKAELLPSRISCAIHPWMMGWIIVQDHPYMAITDVDGKFEIKNLPADGKLMLKVWHEKLGYVKEVQIDGERAQWKRGRYTPDLKDGKETKHLFRVDPGLFAKK